MAVDVEVEVECNDGTIRAIDQDEEVALVWFKPEVIKNGNFKEILANASNEEELKVSLVLFIYQFSKKI